MCYTIYMPIVCTLQTISRIIIACLFAIEDLIRMCIHTVHSYISIVLQCCSLVPMCLALCCMKQCYTYGLCSSGCTPKFNSIICGYGAVIVLTIFVIILIFYNTDWLESFLTDIGLYPCNLFRKFKSNACQIISGVTMNTTYSTRALHTSTSYPVSERTMKIYLDKYREIQSEDADNFYDTTSSSIQELVDKIKSLSKIESKRSSLRLIRLQEKQIQVSSQTTKEKSTITLPETMNTTYLEEYHRSALVNKLRRHRILEKGLKEELIL
ncbi:unnamed protein product [Leptosia nina]|uniref:Uncharacterized protein n=1 Tax=Leptosia nina TaxID=320188 RepID=A0AAV1JTP0_9NEOP